MDSTPQADTSSFATTSAGAPSASPAPAPVDAVVADTPPPPPPAPPRPVWNTVTPAEPWCPDKWREHLDAIVPGLFSAGLAAADGETVGCQLGAAPWQLVLSSRRGRLHAHRGDHREDAGAIVTFAGGWCAAVADGAGSAKYSRLGSAIATAVATQMVQEHLAAGDATDTACADALHAAAQAVNDRQREFAARAGLALRDLRTTLLVAVRHHDQLGTMQVGDGAMALLHRDGTVSHPHAAATGDYSGEVAHFLPDDGALDVLRASVRAGPTGDLCAVLLASDGVEDPWYPFTRFARPLLQTLAHGHVGTATDTVPVALIPGREDSVLRATNPVAALGEWLAFEKRGENDDRTLCVAYTPALLSMTADAPRD